MIPDSFDPPTSPRCLTFINDLFPFGYLFFFFALLYPIFTFPEFFLGEHPCICWFAFLPFVQNKNQSPPSLFVGKFPAAFSMSSFSPLLHISFLGTVVSFSFSFPESSDCFSPTLLSRPFDVPRSLFPPPFFCWYIFLLSQRRFVLLSFIFELAVKNGLDPCPPSHPQPLISSCELSQFFFQRGVYAVDFFSRFPAIVPTPSQEIRLSF